MPAQAHPYLVLTDGTTTITHQDGAGGVPDWPLLADRWAPNVASLRPSPLTGQTDYTDVVESYTIEVRGTDADDALANLDTLARLLDQAERWARGDVAATAVLVKFVPHGSEISSTANPLCAAILGPAQAGVSALTLSPEWDEAGRNYVIPNVQVSFRRRGLWLLEDEYTDTSGMSSVTNGDSGNPQMTDTETLPSPTRLTIENFGYGQSSGARFHGGFLLIADQASTAFDIEPAEAATATGYTSVAGGLNARNTNVLRYTPTGTAEVFSGALTPAILADADLVAIFANVRPSATTSFLLRARLNSTLKNQDTPQVAIPGGSNYPRWVFLGIAPKVGAITELYLACTASAASSQLDIDTVVVADARRTQILSLIGPGDNDINFITTVGDLEINHNLLTRPFPTVAVDDVPVPYAGNPIFLTKDDDIYAVLLATGGGTAGGGSSGGQEYRQANIVTDAVIVNDWQFWRHSAFLVPR